MRFIRGRSSCCRKRCALLADELARSAAACRRCRPMRKPTIGNRRLPDASIDERQFIAEHQITYVVTFDEYDIAKCRVEPAR